MSNVWSLIVEVYVPDNVPDRMRWTFCGMTSTWLDAHRSASAVRFAATESSSVLRLTVAWAAKLDRARTYAALVSSNGAAEQEMDEFVEEGTDEQQTTSARSWVGCLLYTSPSPRD